MELEDRIPSHSAFNISCDMLNAIIPMALDWRELENRLVLHGWYIPKKYETRYDRSDVIYRMAIKASSVAGRFSDQITACLNRNYKVVISEIRELPITQLSSYSERYFLEYPSQIGGLLWALVSDLRCGAQKLAMFYLMRTIRKMLLMGVDRLPHMSGIDLDSLH